MPDFADREATSIIALCRSLPNAPADLHGIVAAKLRLIYSDGRFDGATARVIGMAADELPPWSQDGFQPAREATP